MDGGVRQEEMAERLKREIKEKTHLRRGMREVRNSDGRVSVPEDTSGDSTVIPQEPLRELAAPTYQSVTSSPHIRNHGTRPCSETSSIWTPRETGCTLARKNAREGIAFGRSETVLLMFYLEHLLPFLFPFYRPSALQGGRAWILEMMISSPVVRQATLCQSSYFFSLARGTANRAVVWDTVLTHTRAAFEVLRQSLQVIDGSDITEHLHGAVRIMASIIQVQRFEIAVLSFSNCQAHLNAALALFVQLLDSPSAVEQEGPNSSFNVVKRRLGSSSCILPAHSVQVPSAEQAAFCFSSSLLILDDIIASTVLQEQPRLYEYHRNLLGSTDGLDPTINLEAAVGCQNWVLLEVGEIAVLDAWKQQLKRAGTLDIMELVRRATPIKDSLECHLTRLETDEIVVPKESNNLLDIFTVDHCHPSETPANQSFLVTRVWAHAALVYLFVVVSGWQPASVDVRYHVDQITELLTLRISPPALLRTMVWPFCVAGCLAEPAQEAHIRGLVDALQPPSVFGTIRKALEIMKTVWSSRDTGDVASRDLAACFRSQGDLVLLV